MQPQSMRKPYRQRSHLRQPTICLFVMVVPLSQKIAHHMPLMTCCLSLIPKGYKFAGPVKYFGDYGEVVLAF